MLGCIKVCWVVLRCVDICNQKQKIREIKDLKINMNRDVMTLVDKGRRKRRSGIGYKSGVGERSWATEGVTLSKVEWICCVVKRKKILMWAKP